MRFPTIFVSAFAAALTAAAFWANGSSVGGTVVSSLILGLAVLLTARNFFGVLAQISVAATYLAATALASIGPLLVNRSMGQANEVELLQPSLTIPAVMLGYAVCYGFLRAARTNAALEDPLSTDCGH